MLAEAANEFLESLYAGHVPDAKVAHPIEEGKQAAAPGGIESDEEARLIEECNGWVVEQDLPAGDSPHEIQDPDTGELLAVLDLAWPKGLQEGLSQKVALLINETEETGERANRAGYRYFIDVQSFKEYVKNGILALPVLET